MMEMSAVLPHKESFANMLQLGVFAVFFFIHGWNTRERGSMGQLRVGSRPPGGIIGHWLGMNRRPTLGLPC
jgi:hypothetical protein